MCDLSIMAVYGKEVLDCLVWMRFHMVVSSDRFIGLNGRLVVKMR